MLRKEEKPEEKSSRPKFLTKTFLTLGLRKCKEEIFKEMLIKTWQSEENGIQFTVIYGMCCVIF